MPAAELAIPHIQSNSARSFADEVIAATHQIRNVRLDPMAPTTTEIATAFATQRAGTGRE
jgi:hypothetical protein